MKFTHAAIAAVTVATLSFAPPALVRAGEAVKGGTILETASFVGENGHTVSGQVQIIQKGEVSYLVLGEDFSFDGAPDPRLGFSDGNTFVQASLFSGLNKDSGKQVYRLPADFDPNAFDEITIWCQKFGVSLAEAKY